MSRTIQSPGVEIREIDQSIITNTNTGTNIFLAGYSPQGPTSEIIQVTSVDDLQRIYGVPTNAAERYFYYSAKTILDQSNANLNVARLPYDYSIGNTSQYYTMLDYGVGMDALSTNNISASTFALSAGNSSHYNDALSGYYIVKPVQKVITKEFYDSLKDGTYGWDSKVYNTSNSVLSGAILVVNKNKSIVESNFSGYYVVISDQTVTTPTSLQLYDGVTNIYVNNSTYPTISISLTSNGWINIPTVSNWIALNQVSFATEVSTGSYDFLLTNAVSAASYTDSVSEVIANAPAFNISTNEFKDTIIVSVFKLRPSIFGQDPNKLDYILAESFVGSLDSTRKVNNINGGAPVNFFIQDVVNANSDIIDIYVNPYFAGNSPDVTKNVVWSNGISGSNEPIKYVKTLNRRNILTVLTADNVNDEVAIARLGPIFSDSLFNLGDYQTKSVESKYIGSIPTKLEKVLRKLENKDIYNVDVIVDAGLSTIFAEQSFNGLSASSLSAIYDDIYYNTSLDNDLYNESGNINSNTVIANWKTVTDVFVNFAENGRKDCFFISDVLRYVFVQGNVSVLKDENKNFSQHIARALKNLYGPVNSSYAGTYANWGRCYDGIKGKYFWLPMSGHISALLGRTDQNYFPWSAPMGLNRGILSGITELAISPNQKERDQLYRININPIVNFPNDGLTVFGQKTLQKKPSAFDRINVRRLFLWLEKRTEEVAKYFIAEPNTTYTRTRFKNTLTPIFDLAKNNEGVYEYLIKCDTSNNTPDTIDQNELHALIYIKPVRTAEFIVIDFIATKTGASFSENA